MSRIRSSKTKPELKVETLLKQLNFAYHPKDVYGNPDFANGVSKIALFIDGCFWHICPKHYVQPKSNSKYWENKAKLNKIRDRVVDRTLRSRGWTVIRIWEHQITMPIENRQWYKNLNTKLMVIEQ
ncbi:MAG: DNA mismatch endonuclease Vsr [Nitrososphaerota archaeon]|nr:DNA mismatch endonuclease Vsr [Nitrososphaerota archaeon]